MKQIIDALSMTSHVHNWLASSTSPQILHVFDSACNLINERREILSVVTQAVGAGLAVATATYLGACRALRVRELGSLLALLRGAS